MKQEKTDIILVHYKSVEMTKLSVKTITVGTKIPYRLIVVNNSQDDLHFDNENIVVINPKENLNWVGGIQKGLELSKSKYFVICNNDILVPPNWLENMLKHFKSDVAMVGPISDRVTGRQGQEYTLFPTHIEEEADFLVGFCTVIKRKAYEQVNGHDNQFFSADDIDLCLRLKEKGWRLLIARDVFVKHLGGLTTTSRMVNEEGIKKLIAKHGEEKIFGIRDENGICLKRGIMTPRPTMVICIPCATDPYFDMFASQLTWKVPPHTRYILSNRTLVQKARRSGIDIALREDSDYLMFIDSDMKFGAMDIYRLLSYDKDMIGAMTHRRKPPYQPCIFKYNKKIDHYEFIEDITYKEGLIKVDAMGMAFTLIKTKVLKALPEPATACEFTIHPKTRGIVGEDINLCKHIKKAGFNIWVDTTFEVDHIGDPLMVNSKVRLQFLEYQKHLIEQEEKNKQKIIIPKSKLILPK